MSAAEDDPAECMRVNVLGTYEIARKCSGLGLHMIYISTDAVFEGAAGAPFSEDDEPRPTSVYAMSKYLGEDVVRSLLPAASTILRLSFLKGFAFDQAFTNVFFSGDTADVIAREVLRASFLRPVGTYHIGTGRKSIYDLAVRIRPGVVAARAPQGRDLSLDSSLWEMMPSGATGARRDEPDDRERDTHREDR
jgi:dTDP-4-dehydrorhamnose reductase